METLAYELFGSGERIALIHTINQSARSWTRVSAHLARSFEVMAVDLALHGKSADIEVANIHELASLMGDTAGRATYVGYFTGGRVALELAFMRPELVERLVLIGFAAGLKDEEARRRRRAGDDTEAAGYEQATPTEAERLFRERITTRLARSDFQFDPEGVAIETAANLENNPRNMAKILRRLGNGTLPPLHDRLHKLEMPVLVVCGEHGDEFLPDATEIAALIGENATFASLEQAWHPAPFEQPDRFAELLMGWIDATR